VTASTLGLDPRVTLAIHVLAAIATVAAILAIAAWLRAPGTPPRTLRGGGFGIYESGAPVAQAATGPVPAAYFQIAAFFVIFDFEAAVLYTWAVSAPEAGVTGLVSAGVFILVLLAALAYLWLDGALDTGPARAAGRAGARA
jgi:NADH-quinone oxidoreductase subunit A